MEWKYLARGSELAALPTFRPASSFLNGLNERNLRTASMLLAIPAELSFDFTSILASNASAGKTTEAFEMKGKFRDWS